MVFWFQNCSDLLWEKNVLLIKKNYIDQLKVGKEDEMRNAKCSSFQTFSYLGVQDIHYEKKFTKSMSFGIN